MRNGDFDDAAAAFARASVATPDNAVLRLVTGVALSTVRRVDLAVNEFRRATQLADEDPIAALLLQGALAERGSVDAAQSVYLDTVRRFSRGPEAGGGLEVSYPIRHLGHAIAQFPDSPILHLLLGDAYQMGEQWERADAAYRKAIALAPAWAKPRVNYGLSRLAQGQPDQAAQIFQQALERDPRNAQVILLKGEAEREAGRVKDAIVTYRMIENEPRVAAQAVTGLGQAYAADGNVAEAIKNLNRAQKISPRDPAPSAALAEVQSRAGNFAAAEEAYDTALRLSRTGGLFGTQPVLYRALAETQIAAGKPDAALETIKRALADEPTSGALWHRLAGRALVARGDRSRAAREFKVALDTDPSLFPMETLTAIEASGLMEAIVRSYQAEAEGIGGYRPLPEQGGGIYLTVPTGPMLKESGALEGRARARSALAHFARYRNDVADEVRQRETLTGLRSRAKDWFLLGEAYDQRAKEPARAAAAYKKALDLGGLSDDLAARARARHRVLTTAP